MLSVLFLGVVVCFISYLIQDYVKFKRLPPGVYGVPILGYLPFMEKNHMKTLAKLAEKYGNIFSVRLGTANVVFLCDWKSVKDALSNSKILGKPKIQFGGFFQQKGLVGSDGPLWRQLRTISLRIMHDLGVGRQVMEANIQDELSYFLNQLDAHVGKPCNIDRMLYQSVLNNITYLIFGHRFEYDDPVCIRLLRMQQDFNKAIGALSPLNFLPFLTKLVTLAAFGFKSFADDAKFFVNMVLKELRDHEAKSDQEQADDFIAGCLAAKKHDKNTPLTEESILACAGDFFGAGSDTVTVSLKWLLLLTATNAKMQAKVQEEIDRVIGKDRQPAWVHRSHMHYTQAFISEAQRWAPILPLNLPRRAMEDTTIDGHFIAKDTQIFVNFWAVSRDPCVWKDADTFRPDRFLDDNGQGLKKCEAVIPFSYGKRSCVGEAVGQREIFLYFVSILQKYHIRIPDGHEVTLEGDPKFSLIPKQPPVYVFSPRE